LESLDRGRARVWAADEEDKRTDVPRAGFPPSTYVAFEPRLTLPGGVRLMLATVFAFSDDSSALLLLYNGEDVLLRAMNGNRHVPTAALDWWEGEGVSDLVS
jgi:hypothetical protein